MGFSKKRRSLTKSRSVSTFQRKEISNFVGVKKKVRDFFVRDDVSRMTTGKKQTITKDKKKMQKRFLLDTMKTLHRKYLAENPAELSYSMFCRLRPFWVVHPSLADWETCMCKLHENLTFVAVRLKQQKQSGHTSTLCLRSCKEPTPTSQLCISSVMVPVPSTGKRAISFCSAQNWPREASG